MASSMDVEQNSAFTQTEYLLVIADWALTNFLHDLKRMAEYAGNSSFPYGRKKHREMKE